ncbi:MAG: hypothetical protein PHE25_06190 [Candidatus Gracilibacteria bacterium]|nr:hypothetical protein [Candidatus Gracilibacteria bacterium]
MQYYLLSILSIPFLYLNFKIIRSDIKEKKIPNKYLGYLLLLLPFIYVYNFFYFDINYLFFLLQIILTFLVSFILYYFGVWAAGDAKYLLVLALFIPHIGIIPFIGNIALLTIFYLFLYFLWFYFGKCLFYPKYAKSLWINIKVDLDEKWQIYKKNKGGKTFLIILKWTLFFLIAFVSIRLARIYLFADIKQSQYYLDFIKYFKNYSLYFILFFGFIFLGIIYIFRLLFSILKKILIKRFNLKSNNYLEFSLILVLLFILIYFVFYEYEINPSEIKSYLIKIFSLYIGLWTLFKVLRYSYKITFQLAEQDFINIEDLKVGDIVDKDYLIKIFGEQKCLGFKFNEKDKKRKDFLYIIPEEYFLNIQNPIDKEDLELLKKIYKVVNKYHKKEKTSNFSEVNFIKILKTFAFGGYIFVGFLITFLLQNKIYEFFITQFLSIFHIHS